MTKSDLINRLYLKLPQMQLEDVDAAVRLTLHKMEDALGSGGRIEIRGFGSFSLHHRKARMGRNPKNGNAVPIPEKYVAHFKPGKALREAIKDSRSA